MYRNTQYYIIQFNTLYEGFIMDIIKSIDIDDDNKFRIYQCHNDDLGEGYLRVDILDDGYAHEYLLFQLVLPKLMQFEDNKALLSYVANLDTYEEIF